MSLFLDGETILDYANLDYRASSMSTVHLRHKPFKSNRNCSAPVRPEAAGAAKDHFSDTIRWLSVQVFQSDRYADRTFRTLCHIVARLGTLRPGMRHTCDDAVRP